MSTPDILKRIAESTLKRVAERRTRPIPERRADIPKPRRGILAKTLRRPSSDAPPRFLCEIKHASPSKGVLREPFDAESLAAEFGRMGADALSVLTEPEFFLGTGENLTRARLASGLPCLAKDFILDSWQVEEAAALGASGVLLIAALLPGDELGWLIGSARVFGLDALVEVHDEQELDRALAANADLIGINHRDLRTFEVDTTLTERLRPRVPPHVTLVSESGIASPDDAVRLARAGADALLIGEYFMRADRPGEALFQLRRATEVAVAGAPSVRTKICGLARPDDAREAVRAGADFIGVVLSDGPRVRTLDEAQGILAAAREERPGIRALAVTRDPEENQVRTILQAGFDGLQLHGNEAPEQVRALRASHPRAILWKALAVASESDLARANHYRAADAILFESPTRGQRLQVPFSALAAFAAQRPLVLAGGLTPNNVGEAVREARPWAVDVSSGVERKPAIKDAESVRAFVRHAHEAAKP